MTSPHSRALPPLTDLPPPPRLAEEPANLVPPEEILAESTAALRRRLLRRSWAPGLVLLGLWYVLLLLYVTGASPTFWFLSLLASLAEPSLLRAAMLGLGFTSGGLGAAFALLPLGATVVSLALGLLAPALLIRLRPRRHLSEEGFQRAVSTVSTATLMALPAVVVLVTPLSVLLPLSQPWSGLGPGPLSSWCLALLVLQGAWLLVRRTVPAAPLLGLTDAQTLHTTARIGTDPDQRRAAAKQVLAQDRRHLPPNPGTAAEGGALSPRGAATALALLARASLRWVVPALAGLGWLVFGIADLVTVITRFGMNELTGVESPLHAGQLLLAAPVAGCVLLALALTPALAVRLAASQRGEVLDQRTYREWSHRARVNPWEARVVGLTGWLSAVWVLLGCVLLAVLVPLLQVGTPLAWVWLVLGILVLAPLVGAAAASAMRTGLRDVLYGPAGDYMRREVPYALIAPDIGTRTDRGRDPAVRAAQRARLLAAGGEHGPALAGLDASGERLWVDENAPGASDTAVREADLARGLLPDFGGEGSPFTGGGRDAAAPDGAGQGSGHEIPGSVTGLREP
ncbi:hypothetical protein [Brachybacterium saurashtrense]|uniref:ABC transporter permease n=1 Tax=Brachybacterium saurashtrense TaxID=556288 RepID=A0A345YQN8_9MICO|nr:hypothetical protein [Brachybacterium saurashtrense]AXK46240.1 hypothetical protein DWV08_11890 [Brachybacterium saurashtrense]RRR23980.1 hypothetical protein DXU92_03640 [Brachybacterium saurashtrense]